MIKAYVGTVVVVEQELPPEDQQRRERILAEKAQPQRVLQQGWGGGAVIVSTTPPQYTDPDDLDIIREGIVQDVGALPEGLPDGTPVLHPGDKVYYPDGSGYKVKDVRVIGFPVVLAIEQQE